MEPVTPTPTPTERPAQGGPARRLLPTRHVDVAMLARLARRASVAEGRDRQDVVAPFTGEVLGAVPLGTPEDVEEAVRRARRAQPAWAELSWDRKARVFLRFYDLVLARQEELLDLVQLESGKSRSDAFEEVMDVPLVTGYYVHHGEDHIKPRRRKGLVPFLTETDEYHHPKGVVGFIAPWNYPLTLAITDAVPALLAGNAVLVKPDRQTPYSALWVADKLAECGLPPDVFQVVPGAGSTLGEPLIRACDYVGFTGSTQTGRTVARQAGENLIGCSLELGGKNPMIILEDADVEEAAREAVRGAFSNTGQLCISIERLYVQAPIWDRFLSRLVEETKALKLGGTLDWSEDVGSLASESQLETVRAHVEDAVKKGAQLRAGGRTRHDLGPWFWEPTVLTDVKPGMTVYDQETFGPVLSVYRFETLDEAVGLANGTPYGLNGAIWSKDRKKAQALAVRLKVGTVNINESYAAAWASVDAPMGGMKDSGLGRRHGREGILKYTESQTVALQRGMPIKAPPGVSQERWAQIMTGAIRLMRRVPGVR